MVYKPKFKQKELRQIARNISSTDDYKSNIDPVKYEWHPKLDLVYLHMSLDMEDDPNATYKLAYPMRPFEIGYKAWQAELFHERDVQIKNKQFRQAQQDFYIRAGIARLKNILKRMKK